MKSVLTATVTGLGLIFTTLGTGILAGRAEAMPTFAKEVAPILFNNCVSCHRPGDIAPMSFLSYCGRGTTLFTLYSDLPFDEDIFAEAIESAAFKPHRRPSP